MLGPVLVSLLTASVDEVCGPAAERSWACERVLRITGSEAAAEVADALEEPIAVALILLGAFVATRLSRLVVRLVVRRLERVETQESIQRLKARARLDVLETSQQIPAERRAQRAATIGVAVRGLISAVIWTAAVILCLHVVGVDLGPLLAGAGLLGVALGFGAQRLVADFLAGLFMIV